VGNDHDECDRPWLGRDTDRLRLPACEPDVREIHHDTGKGGCMQAIADLKSLMLEMLENAFQTGDVQATQQLGINMSNAVKREGVMIIQNQNLEVYSRIMPSMVRAIKLCDAMESSWRQQIEIQIDSAPRQLPAPEAIEVEEDADPIEACCEWLFENHVTWQDMQDLMKSRYLNHVLGQFRTKTEAAKWLGVGSTYLCKLTKEASACTAGEDGEDHPSERLLKLAASR
jgi:hypothetical protein